MKNKVLTLKDFILSKEKEISTLSREFQQYLDQQKRYGSKSYWVDSESGVGARMRLSHCPEKIVDAYIANDYLGMSQNEETKAAGVEAVLKYGTGACAAKCILFCTVLKNC